MKMLEKFKATAATLGLGLHVGAREEKAKAAERDEERRKQGRRRKGQSFGSIIAYERVGPLYRQGEPQRTTLPSGAIMMKPTVVRFFRHRFLHATKGWRETTYIPAGMGRRA